MDIEITNEQGVAVVRAGSNQARLAAGQSVTVKGAKGAKLGDVEGEVANAGWDHEREQLAAAGDPVDPNEG